MKKRLLSLILVFAMVFGMIPTMAFACGHRWIRKRDGIP